MRTISLPTDFKEVYDPCIGKITLISEENYDREPADYRHARLLDHGRGDWAMTIARRYLYETADAVRLDALVGGSWAPLADLVDKIRREERYHVMHIGSWLERLALADGEPRDRLIAALDTLGPDAGTVFTPLPSEAGLVGSGRPRPPDGRARGGLAGPRRAGLRAPATPGPPATAGSRRRPHRPRQRLRLAVGRVHGRAQQRSGCHMVTAAEPTERDVRVALAEVPDPEIPVLSVVDLGIIHRVTVGPDAIEVAILPTFVGCPALDLIRASIGDHLGERFGRPVRVETTFEVPWTSERISDVGRMALREAGIAPPDDGRGHPLPVLRVGRRRDGQRVRAHAVPLAVLLPRLPPAVRGAEVGVTIVGIVGAGVMGAGIGQVALEAGWEVVLHDVDEDAIERATGRIREGLARRAAKLDLDADSIDDWVDGRLDRLRHAHTLDGLASESTIIIEAAVEDLDLKQAIFRALDAESSRDVLLATNTSALPVTAIAEAAKRADRVLGLHFFNPVPLMDLVEVVAGARDGAGGRRARDRHRPRVGQDPGPQCRSAGLHRQSREPPVHDRGAPDARRGRRRRGRDRRGDARRQAFRWARSSSWISQASTSNLAAARGVWAGLGRPDRLAPSPVQERLVAAGRLGRKSGGGFYRYDDGRRGAVDPEFGDAPAARTVGGADPGAGSNGR